MCKGTKIKKIKIRGVEQKMSGITDQSSLRLESGLTDLVFPQKNGLTAKKRIKSIIDFTTDL